MNSLVRHLRDFVYPRACVVCGCRLTVTEEVLCTACNWLLPRTRYVENAQENRMTQLFMGQFPLERAAGWFFYTSADPTVRLIHNAKYYGDVDLCYWLGQTAAKEFLPYDFFGGIDVIVPLPLTWRRKWERGYNQCYEIARGIASVTGLRIENKAVKRIYFEKSQTLLKGDDRLSNVIDAFKMNRPEKLRGKHILLFDDVVTTGATLSSCGRELAKAGDVRISVMTIGVTKT